MLAQNLCKSLTGATALDFMDPIFLIYMTSAFQRYATLFWGIFFWLGSMPIKMWTISLPANWTTQWYNYFLAVIDPSSFDLVDLNLDLPRFVFRIQKETVWQCNAILCRMMVVLLPLQPMVSHHGFFSFFVLHFFFWRL